MGKQHFVLALLHTRFLNVLFSLECYFENPYVTYDRIWCCWAIPGTSGTMKTSAQYGRHDSEVINLYLSIVLVNATGVVGGQHLSWFWWVLTPALSPLHTVLSDHWPVLLIPCALYQEPHSVELLSSVSPEHRGIQVPSGHLLLRL